MKSLFTFLLTAFAVSSVIGGDLIYESSFSSLSDQSFKKMEGRIEPDQGRLASEGNSLLYGNSLSSNNEFTEIFRTDSALPGNAVYEVEFDYKILQSQNGAHIFALFFSPSDTWSNAATSFTSILPDEASGKAKIRAVLSCIKNDYEFSIHIYGKAEVVIDNLKLYKVNALPVLSSGESDLQIPLASGAPEIAIESPKFLNDTVLSASAYGVLPENPDNTTAFSEFIAAARKLKASRLVLPKGTYYFNDFGKRAILFDNMADFEFDGSGSLLVFFSRDSKPVFWEINNCRRAVFKNFSLDWNFSIQPLSTRARVLSGDPESGVLLFETPDYQKHPDKTVKIDRIVPLDNQSLKPGRKGDSSHCRVKDVVWISDNRFQAVADMHGKDWRVPEPGDNYVIPHCYWAGYSLYTGKSEHITFESVNVYASRGFGFYVASTDYVRFSGCKVAVNPDALPARMMSTNSDALDFLNSRKGNFIIENCEFSRSGDDFINLNSSSYCGLLYTDDPNEIIAYTDYPDTSFPVSSNIEIRNYDFSPAGFKSVVLSREKVGKEQVKIRFKDPVPRGLSGKSIFFFPDWKMHNFIIRNNVFRDGFCRAVLPCGENGTIEGNLFEGNAMPDLLISMDFLTKNRIEGNGIRNLLIKNNRFINSNKMGLREASAAIHIPMWRPNTWYPIVSNISIVGNRFINPSGAVLFASSVNRLLFSDNVIEAADSTLSSFRYNSDLVLGRCSSDVSVKSNRWIVPHGSNLHGGVIYNPAESRNISISANTESKR